MNKDISVFRGLVCNDNTVEYIPQGIFGVYPEDIKTNSTDKTIEITMKDKSVLVDCKYGGIDNIIYPSTVGLFVKEIVERHGLELKNINFPLSDFVLNERPNFDLESTTERYLISAAAELSGSSVQVTRDGKVLICKPSDTNITIKKLDYKKLGSKEKKFGPINCVILAKKNINDDFIYKDQASIDLNGLCEWRIEDNPYVDLIRQQSVDIVGQQIVGMEIIPFEINEAIDSYVYDFNDKILIEDEQGNIFSTNILNICSANRIFTKLSADIQNSTSSKLKLAGSSKESINQIKLDVDHVKNEMNIIATEINEQDTKIAQINMKSDLISQKVQDNEIKVEQAMSSTNLEISIINQTLENELR